MLLLAEMAARALKGCAVHARGRAPRAVVPRLQTFILTQFFNVITATRRFEEFWREQVYHAIVARFGQCAISTFERANYQVSLEPCIPYILRRVQEAQRSSSPPRSRTSWTRPCASSGRRTT